MALQREFICAAAMHILSFTARSELSTSDVYLAHYYHDKQESSPRSQTALYQRLSGTGIGYEGKKKGLHTSFTDQIELRIPTGWHLIPENPYRISQQGACFSGLSMC